MVKKGRVVLLFGLLILLFSVLSIYASSETNDSVVLLVEGQKNCEIMDKEIAVQVDIEFNNMALINESLMLSYHIYDSDGNLILFEGNRTPLNAFVGNTIRNVPVIINLNDIEELSGYKYIVVEFDIVDEKNLYWFSKNEEVNITTARIIYDGSFMAKVKQVVREIVSNPILLLLNLAIYAACVFGIVKYKKTQ